MYIKIDGVITKTLNDIKRDLDYLIINIEIDNEDVSDSLIDAIARLHSELNKFTQNT